MERVIAANLARIPRENFIHPRVVYMRYIERSSRDLQRLPDMRYGRSKGSIFREGREKKEGHHRDSSVDALFIVRASCHVDLKSKSLKNGTWIGVDDARRELFLEL